MQCLPKTAKAKRAASLIDCLRPTANPRTNIMDFRGFDSSIILIIRGGIIMSIGDFPESLSQGILVGIMLVDRLGVSTAGRATKRNEVRPCPKRDETEMDPDGGKQLPPVDKLVSGGLPTTTMP